MMIALEKAIQKSMTIPLRSVHHRSFLWTLVQELLRSTTYRFVVPRGSGAPFLEIAPSLQEPTDDVRVVGAIEVYSHRLWQPSQRWQGIQGRSQKQ